MKRTFLLLALSLATLGANAQYTLTDTVYTQNFNSLTTTIPTGWKVYTGATTTGLGATESINKKQFYGLPNMLGLDTNCVGIVLGGGFKNFPSANSSSLAGFDFCPSTPTTGTPDTGNFTDRALGVRQVKQTNSTFPNSDGGTGGGAAFVFNIANTTKLYNFTMDFKLQSLDTSSDRVSTWTVDYGFGSTPTSFTAVTPTTGTPTSGGSSTITNNFLTYSFGSDLDNKSTPVWIRIVCLAATTGSGNRASTAIDDFRLHYMNKTGVEDITASAEMILTVLGEATSDKINFAYSTGNTDNLNFAIYDLSGRVIRNEMISNTGVFSVSDLNLASGMYIAKINNENGTATTKVMVK